MTRRPPTRSAPKLRPAAARTSGTPRGRAPAASVAEPPAPEQVRLTVAAIGASAGGLEALTQLLQNLDPQTGVALVVVQHLAPRQESALPELLAAVSPIPVVAATDAMPLEPNRVHVMPPNVQISLEGSRLRLGPRPQDRSKHAPIDYFFRSVAHQGDVNVIGVVLSGSASDGALGLREIKAEGGITIAQEPRTARYDGMPRAAIATGAVDLVLPAEDIARELKRLSRHPLLVSLVGAQSDPLAEGDELGRLFQLLRGVSGVDFAQYKLPTIRRRLQRRMALHKIERLGEYRKHVESRPDEIRELYRDLLIHVTRFFRDPEAFEALKTAVFPEIVRHGGEQRPIRAWVPGCATGEEAYSLAIALLEFLGRDADSLPIQVFATDVSEETVQRARAGLFNPSIAADVSPERLRRFFTQTDGEYRVSKLVRDSCIFARQDLTRDAPFSKLDLILCRNVLIYLGQPLQRRILGIFHYALRPGGFLMLGSAESITQGSEPFAIVDKRHRIFRRRPGRLSQELELPQGIEPPGPGGPRHAAPAADLTRGALQNEVVRALLARYAPAAVLIDHEFRIVHTRGKTGAYLELASGEASLSLLKMAREGLLHALRTALHEAQRNLKPVRRPNVTVRTNGREEEVHIQVLPVGERAASPHYLVVFEPVAKVAGRRSGTGAKDPARGSTQEMRRLQQELTSSRQYLQAIIQDLEAANEELQSANEEVLSSNEELQSTNEELDTAKEELQSTNEELNTVNEELNARNDELNRINSDLINLLSSVPAAVVIVDANLAIRRFTPMAEQLFNLIASDVGRPLGDIKPRLEMPDFEAITREVIDEVMPREVEVRDRDGRYLSLRIRPYKNQENKIDGAILTLTDVDEARRTGAPVDPTHLAHTILAGVACPIIALEDAQHVLAVNTAARTLLDLPGADRPDGRPLSHLAGGRFGSAGLAARLARLASDGEPFGDVAVELSHAPVRRIRIDGRRVTEGVENPMILLTLTEEAGGDGG